MRHGLKHPTRNAVGLGALLLLAGGLALGVAQGTISMRAFLAGAAVGLAPIALFVVSALSHLHW